MNISIAYDNQTCYLEPTPLPDDVQNLIAHTLRYHPDGYKHVWSFKSKKWDGYNYLYNYRDQTFRRGLLDRVVNTLQYVGHHVTTKFMGIQTPLVEHKYTAKVTPYDYQLDALKAADVSPIGLLVSPTGTGKTVIISMLINHLKRRTMVLVTDQVLLDQMQQALQRTFDQPIGMIGDGEFDLQEITVSTIQSLHSIKKAKAISSAEKRKELMKHLLKVGTVISDEGHLYDSDQVSQVMGMFTHADRFYGFSATPYGWDEISEKTENIELEQHFGRVIYDTRSMNFVKLAVKVPVYVQVINRTPVRKMYNTHFKEKTGEPDFTKNYRECLETELLKNEQYHEEVADYVRKMADAGSSVFVHAAHSLDFGKSIHERIPGAVLVNGKTPRLKRREIYDAVRAKDVLALVSDVGGTGLDIQSLNCLVLASDVKDIRQLMGRVARVDRAHGSTKDHGILADFNTDTVFLRKHYKARRAQYDAEGMLIMG